jgi:hypothetical protein
MEIQEEKIVQLDTPHLKVMRNADNFKEIMPNTLFTWQNPHNKFGVVVLHWQAVPGRDLAWLRKVRGAYSYVGWRKEMEMDWEVITGGSRIFPHFTSENIKKMEVDNRYPLVRIWDVSYLHPCIVFAQKVDGDARILKNVQFTNLHVREAIMKVKAFCSYAFPDPKIKFIDVADPFSIEQKYATSDNTILELFIKYDIHPQYTQYDVAKGIYLVDMLIDAGRFWVDPTADIVVEGCLGGYVIDEKTGKPKKDSFFIHSLDDLRYFATIFFTYDEIIKKNDVKKAPMTSEEYYEERFNNQQLKKQILSNNF